MAIYNSAAFRRGKNQNLSIQETRSESMPRRLRWKGIANIGVIALAGGLVAGVAAPAYAFTPDSYDARASARAGTELTRTLARAVDMPTPAATVARDGFSATTRAELAAATVATSYASSVGTVAAIGQPIRTFSITSVFAVAARHQGVRYVFGGASPRGFDCSGLVKYVWAKFGKKLPHSSNAQARMGKRISRAAAKPGDLVVLPGHIGFYAGNGKILHAPYPGQRVRIQPIWTNSYYIVRL